MRQVLLATVIALMPLTAIAQDYNKGLRAYQAQDYATALKEWRPLAEGGVRDVQFLLGQMYHRGQGVPQDYTKAEQWYLLAATRGYAPAFYNLGYMYYEGHGVPQDFAKAHMYFFVAFTKGLQKAADGLTMTEVMVPEQTAEAERRAKVCMQSGYRKCD